MERASKFSLQFGMNNLPMVKNGFYGKWSLRIPRAQAQKTGHHRRYMLFP